MATSDTTKPAGRSSNGTPLFRRVCSGCGAVSLVDSRRLEKKCSPCAMKDRRTHGLASGGSPHPLYKLLKNIDARCRYPSATHYAYYGGRGIRVCQEWRDDPAAFVKWAEDHDWRPGLEVDRIDVDGDYGPENCRLVSHKVNSQRTRRIKTTPDQARTVKQHLADGASVTDAAAKAGVPYMTAWHIKNSGTWSNV